MLHAFNMLRVLTDPRIVLPPLREYRQREGADSPDVKRRSIG